MESSISSRQNPECTTGYPDIALQLHKFDAEATSIAEDEEEEGEGGGLEEEEEQEEEEEEEGEDECDGATQEIPNQGPNKEVGTGAFLCNPAGNPYANGQCEPQQPVQRGAKRSRASTAKERISKMPPCAAGKRSSIYRGVTRHRWTGRYEAHLWDKSTWNQNQNKKGKQVYLGAYDDEEAAARAYDLAALKYWGPGTLINFPVSDYARDIDEMQSVTREIYLASLRRKSSGFSRGASKTKAISRHLPNGRWDFVSTTPQLAGYGDAGAGRPHHDIGSLGCPSALINLFHFMDWLQPPNLTGDASLNHFKKSFKYLEEGHSSDVYNRERSPTLGEEYSDGAEEQLAKNGDQPRQSFEPYQLPSLGHVNGQRRAGVSALSALSESSMFAKMEERLNAGKGQAASTGVRESAADALAAALAMQDCAESPTREKEENFAGLIDCNDSYMDVHPSDSCVNVQPASTLTPCLPFEIDNSEYLSDQVPSLWNPFDTPLSMLQ